MRFDFFMIPVRDGEAATEELNRLLSSARILTVDRQFVSDGINSHWSICVASQSGSVGKQSNRKKQNVDYREILSEEDFAIYARLRTLRKELADREGVPVYAVFTNEQFAEIVRTRTETLSSMRAIDARVEKYGESVVAFMTNVLSVPATTGDGGAP